MQTAWLCRSDASAVGQAPQFRSWQSSLSTHSQPPTECQQASLADTHEIEAAPGLYAPGIALGFAPGVAHSSDTLADEQHGVCSPEHQQRCIEPPVTVLDHIHNAAAEVLDALLSNQLPSISFTPQTLEAADAQQAAAPGVLTNGQQPIDPALQQSSSTRSTQQAAAVVVQKLSFDVTNQKVTDRLCRAVVLLDAIHVRRSNAHACLQLHDCNQDDV